MVNPRRDSSLKKNFPDQRKNIPDKRTVPIGCHHVEVDVRGATDGHCVQVAVPASISVNIFIL